MEFSELKPGDVFVGEDNYYYLIIRDSNHKSVLCFLTEHSSRKEYMEHMAITLSSEQEVTPRRYICNIMKPLFQLQLKIQEIEANEKHLTSPATAI